MAIEEAMAVRNEDGKKAEAAVKTSDLVFPSGMRKGLKPMLKAKAQKKSLATRPCFPAPSSRRWSTEMRRD